MNELRLRHLLRIIRRLLLCAPFIILALLPAVAASSPAWLSIGPTQFAGRILSLAFSPGDASIVYAGAAGGGLWKSTDGGTSWSPLTDGLASLAIGGVAVGPDDPDLLVIGTGEGAPTPGRAAGVGILRSTDGGTSWNPTSLTYSIDQGHGFHFVAANPIAGTFLAGATDGLWRSSDTGETWAQVRVGGDYYDATWKPGDASVCYTCKGNDTVGNNVKISTDDGVTWSKAGTGQPLSVQIGKTKIAVTAADPEVVYTLYSEQTTGGMLGVYLSTDGASTWSLLTTTPDILQGQGLFHLSLAADPDDAGRVLAGGTHLWVSTDSGATFTQTDDGVHRNHNAVAYEPGSADAVWVATDGGVWRSPNDGSDWAARNEGLVTLEISDVAVAQSDPSFTLAAVANRGVFGRGGGDTWYATGAEAEGRYCAISPSNADAVYAQSSLGLPLKSPDAGLHWTPFADGIAGQLVWASPLALDPGSGSHLYTATGGGVFRTTDGGVLWVPVAPQVASWISISAADGDVVWTLSGADVDRTTDDGSSWSAAAPFGFPTGAATRIVADPGDANVAFVVFSGYAAGIARVTRTSDLGAGWTDVSGDLPQVPVNAVAIDPSVPTHWYVGTDSGVWVSTDGGAAWLPYGAGLPNAVISDLEIRRAEGKLVAATHGRGGWETELASAVTGAEATRPAATHLLLDPPAPNPASDVIRLRFAARAGERVTLSVHDVCGRRVARLVTETTDGRAHGATWFTGNTPAGVYFAVLKAGAEETTQKIIVRK